MKTCKECIMPDTRPRITYNSEGVCTACEWKKIKKTKIDYKARKKELKKLCDSIKGKHMYDCIVPVSGGKDSTYVADRMKNEFGLHILTVTITPPLETKLIQSNLERFLQYGYENIKITPNPEIAREINKYGFVEQGRPLLSWTSCLNSIMFRLAVKFDIPLIMFGEEGETEYGGSTEMRYTPYYDSDYAIKIYTEGNDPRQFTKRYTESEMLLWLFPPKEDIRRIGVKVGHWSFYEDWDPYDHYIFATENYGFKKADYRQTGTYTDYGQLDTPLYELHTYMMYLKFGFGRCLQDACIDIRGGRITREEAVKAVEKYDGEYPKNSIATFLEYYDMTKGEFDYILDKHANKKLFEKKDGIWKPKFVIK